MSSKEVRASNFSLMLAADLSKLRGGLQSLDFTKKRRLASRKIDGMRVFVEDGVVMSRNRKPVPNAHVQKIFGRCEGLDGEMVAGDPIGGHVLGRTISALKSRDGEPDVTFFAFDDLRYANLPYLVRLHQAKMAEKTHPGVVQVEHFVVSSAEEVLAHERQWLDEGFEGLMLRDATSVYRYGRCTPTDDDLWKLKRFTDGEAVVTGLEEAKTNVNEAFRDELGRMKRRVTKDARVGNGMVGTILARDARWGDLRLQPGIMTLDERRAQWLSRDLIGKTVHWRCFGYDILNKPRYARFYGVREDI